MAISRRQGLQLVHSSFAYGFQPLSDSTLSLNCTREGGHRVATFISGPVLPAKMRGKKLDGLAHISDWYRLVSPVIGSNGFIITIDCCWLTMAELPAQHFLCPGGSCCSGSVTSRNIATGQYQLVALDLRRYPNEPSPDASARCGA